MKLIKSHKYDFHKANALKNQYTLMPLEKSKNNQLNDPSRFSSVSFISNGEYSTEENILSSYSGINSDFGAILTDDEETQRRENVNDLKTDISMNSSDGMQYSRSNKITNSQKHHAASADNENDLNDSWLTFEKENNETMRRIIQDDIYWGQIIEDRLPQGYGKRDMEDWKEYLKNNVTEIIKIEQGCGRMQNRLVTFSDGVKACVRYRQNTDQIQGELFSYLLGRLLNIENLAPSTSAVIDWDSRLWQQVKQHITESQWKTSRPVVFTKWIPDLESSGIPEQFRPLERHMNKNDIWNITMDDSTKKSSQILIDRLKPTYNKEDSESRRKKLWRKKKIVLNDQIYSKFIELAQWSDLIVFDYLIANLDRVVNNLYNFQWNADIMSAPAHNLAKDSKSQLLVFLDNESGLLHGYRLLKKYEAYHSVLLDNLCIFRKSTIDALVALKSSNPSKLLNELFEMTTTSEVRDVLPPLPDKSMKILSDRIDRVLQQVQKCQDYTSQIDR